MELRLACKLPLLATPLEDTLPAPARQRLVALREPELQVCLVPPEGAVTQAI